MRVLITGGAGFIGAATAAALLDGGHSVTLLDNFASGDLGRSRAGELRLRGARVLEGDILDAGILAEALEDAGAVVHLAAMASVAASVADPAACFRCNLEGTRAVSAAASARGIHRFVFASTAAVYGMEPDLPSSESGTLAPASPYAESKIESERHLASLREEGFEPVLFRFFNVYGPGQDPGSSYSGVITRWVDALRRRAPVTVFGDGSQTRDFVHVDDIAAAIVRSLAAPGAPAGAVNVGSGRSTSLLELLGYLADALGERPDVRFAPSRTGDVLHSRADISRLIREFDFVPATELSAGLRAMLCR